MTVPVTRKKFIYFSLLLEGSSSSFQFTDTFTQQSTFNSSQTYLMLPAMYFIRPQCISYVNNVYYT